MTSAVVSPVRVTAQLESRLSRWLWLVKWLLVVPHLIVLGFLWVAFGVLSVVALIAILVTGRYPRAIFEFNLGVLSWSWRVAYYCYGALGTDRYPPFTLGPAADYPATLDIAYPEHLSRGLALIKWLLALPHYVIIGFFVGGSGYAVYSGGTSGSWSSVGLIGLLVVIVGIALLVTGRYPRGLFDLLLGMNRWVLRVAAYIALMTDQYPPFRLDMGGSEPSTLAVATADRGPAGAGASVPTAPVSTSGRPPAGSAWSTARIVTVVIGSLLLVGGLGAAVGGTALLTADRAGRDGDGFLNTPTHRFTSSGFALVFDPLELHGAAAGDDVGAVVGDIRVHATGAVQDGGVFVGIGPADAVDGYLAAVDRERVVESRTDSGGVQQRLPGGAPATPPTRQSFWVTSTAGPGPQQITWTVAEGRWSLVVMNADGSRPVVTDLSAGATAPGLHWLWIGQYVVAAVALVAGALLVFGAVRRKDPAAATSRDVPRATVPL